jgi:hypothetical protein
VARPDPMKRGQAAFFLREKWQPVLGDKSVNKGIYFKLPEKRRGTKEGFAVDFLFDLLHLCSPYINTLNLKKKLQIFLNSHPF